MYLVGCGPEAVPVHVIASQTGHVANTVRKHLKETLAQRNLVELDDSGRYPAWRAICAVRNTELSSEGAE